MIYQIINNRTNDAVGVQIIEKNASIPFAPDNTDYQQFKQDITNGAELQDAESKVMTATKVKKFLASLP